MAASTRYRLEQYIPGLRQHGVDLQVVHLLGDDYLRQRFNGRTASTLGLIRSGFSRLVDLTFLGKFDAALVHCELLPLMPGWLERVLLRQPYVYDFDDAFYLRYRLGTLSKFGPVLGRKFEQVMASAACITAGNDDLFRYARRFNSQVDFLPTVVDLNHHVPDSTRKTSTFTVGWIGSPSTAPYLQNIRGPLAELAREGNVRLVVVGGAAPAIAGVQIEEVPWSAATEIDLINSFDVGVMPLPDDEWSRGKCAFKLIQYMACAVPVIGSAVGANQSVVTSDCGYLARNHDEWLAALRAFRDSPTLRKQAGEAGRQRVTEHYCLQVTLPRMAAAIQRAAGR